MTWGEMPAVMYVYQSDLVNDERIYSAIEDPLDIEMAEGKLQLGVYKLERVAYLQIKKEIVDK
jgi:hypothetical protein